MLNIHLTLPQVVGFIRTIAERDPENVARKSDGSVGCVYMEQNGHIMTPVCIVGQMFADLGLLRLLSERPSDLSGYTDGLGACSVQGAFWDALSNYGVTADEDAQRFLREVQYKQDGGSAWGAAYAEVVEQWQATENDKMDHEQETLDRKRQALVDLFA